MTDNQARRLDEKLDKVLDTVSDLRVSTAAMHEHIKAVDDDQQDLKHRADKVDTKIERLEYKVLPALGGLMIIVPIVIWLVKGA
jgi:predicted nuclease with TOPRIM domain